MRRIDFTPRSRRIWAPRPTSRQVSSRVSALPVFSGAEIAGGDARGAFLEIDQHAALFALEYVEGAGERGAAAEDVLEHVLAVEPDRHVPAVADIAEDEGELLHRVEGRHVGMALGHADDGLHIEAGALFHQALALLAVGDEVGDGDDLEAVLAGEGQHLRARASPSRRR